MSQKRSLEAHLWRNVLRSPGREATTQDPEKTTNRMQFGFALAAGIAVGAFGVAHCQSSSSSSRSNLQAQTTASASFRAPQMPSTSEKIQMQGAHTTKHSFSTPSATAESTITR